MGILETLTGKKKVLTYEVRFSESEVGVRVTPHVPTLPGSEYIRLWASHQTKILYNLGGLGTTSGAIAVASIQQVTDQSLGPH